MFTGHYIAADISAPYLEQIKAFRADAERGKRRFQNAADLELHNAP